MNRSTSTLWAATILAVLGGCASQPRGPYNAISEHARDTHRAEQLNRKGADLVASDPQRAEKLLREALTADLYYGPAHNNLGVLYYHAGKLYEAAGEFEWARRLMPTHADPRANMALVLEQAGRFDEALDSFGSALAVHPSHVRSLQGLLRLQLRHGRSDEHTAGRLEELALLGETPEWREWARAQATTLRQSGTQ